MERALVFAAALILVSAYALIRGGAPEKVAASMYLTAYAVSVLVTQISNEDYNSVQWMVLIVDAALLFALLLLALRANRYWGIWAVSFQIIAVFAHLVPMLFPQIAAGAYATALLIWSYVALPMLAGATFRHQRRVAYFGSDPSWSR